MHRPLSNVGGLPADAGSRGSERGAHVVSASARAATAGVLAALGLLVAGHSLAPDASARSPVAAADARLQPSGEGLPFDPGRYRDFGDYVRQTRERLKRHKVYMDPHRAGRELAAATPFERAPVAGCPPSASARPSRGILLLHGLSDMPLAMRDLADAFAARCFLVRAMLLPGHGTRAGDLLEVTHEDWLAATRMGLETLKRDADEVFVGGFSLGGLLSVHAVLEEATVRAAFLFSPALALERPWLVRQSVWLRHVLDWLDQDPPDDYARYEAMPVNATAETFLLTRELERMLQRRRVDIPVFMALSADDPVIDVAVNRRLLRAALLPSGQPAGDVSPRPSRGRPSGRRADQIPQQLSSRAAHCRIFPSVGPHRTGQCALWAAR